MSEPQFSIIIPVYNEERRLPKTIGHILDFFGALSVATEIIFVNDGSRDNTASLLAEYQKQHSFRVISYTVNRGKGYAIRKGALTAKGAWVVFFDIDLAPPLTEFTHLQTYLRPDDSVVIGSRRLSGSKIERSESWLRTFLGQSFTRMSNLLVPRITDFTCGFKCFSRSAVQAIFPVAQIDRWGFDTELLYIAYLKHIQVREMPVQWAHDTDSRVRVFQAIISSLIELCTMQLNHWRGRYGKRVKKT